MPAQQLVILARCTCKPTVKVDHVEELIGGVEERTPNYETKTVDISVVPAVLVAASTTLIVTHTADCEAAQ